RARVHPAGASFEPVGEPEVRRHSIAVGHGAVWTLTWTHVPGGSTVSRVDPDRGRVQGQLPVQGSPRQLMVDSDAIYVRVWRRDSSGRVEESLLGVDPARVEAIAEVRISPAGPGRAVRDGVVWSPDGDLYPHEDRGAPPTARRFDARNGEPLDSVEVLRRHRAMAPGPDGDHACLNRRAQSRV